MDVQQEEQSKVISSQAEVSYGYNDGQERVTEEICPAPTLLAEEGEVKLYTMAWPQSGGCGDKLGYSLMAVNYRTTAVSQVVITDTLPAGVRFNNDAQLSQDGGAPVAITPGSQTPLTFTLPALASGQAAIVSFTVDLAGIAPGAYLTNTASLSYSGYTGPAITATDTWHYSCARLQAVKTGPAQVVCGERFDYVVTLKNTGDQTAESVTLTDVLDTCLTVDATGVTVANQTGTPEIRLNEGNSLVVADFGVPAGATVTITIPVTYRCDCV